MKKALSFLTVMLFTGVAFAQTYNTKVHFVPGGAELVAESGATVTVKSGGSLVVEAGATVNQLSLTYGLAAATAAFSSTLDVNGNFTSGVDNYVTTNTASSGAWAFPATVSIGGALSGTSGTFSTTLDVAGNEYHGAALYRSTFTAASGAQAWTGAITSVASITGASLVASSGAITPKAKTLAQLNALTPGGAGELYFCSDCLAGVAVSSGASAGAFVTAVSSTTHIN